MLTSAVSMFAIAFVNADSLKKKKRLIFYLHKGG
jgi:hypothetical protein